MKKATIFIILLISIAAANVYANSGSYSYEPVPGFHAIPLKSDKVEIQHEDLLFDASITGTPDIAFVTAKYTIKNISNEKENLSIAVPYIGDYRKIDMANKTYAISEVMLDGKKITSEIRLIPDLSVKFSDGSFVRNFLYAKDGQEISFMDIIKYLNSSVDINSNDAVKKIEEISKSPADNLPVEVILFNIEIEPDISHELKVSFYQVSGKDRSDTKSYADTYFYFLEPANYWRNFKDINIKVKTPQGYKIAESTPELKKSKNEKNIYSASFATLPEKNLEFNIYRSLNPIEKFTEWFNWWNVYVLMVFLVPILLIAAIIILIVFFARKRKKNTKQ